MTLFIYKIHSTQTHTHAHLAARSVAKENNLNHLKTHFIAEILFLETAINSIPQSTYAHNQLGEGKKIIDFNLRCRAYRENLFDIQVVWHFFREKIYSSTHDITSRNTYKYNSPHV